MLRRQRAALLIEESFAFLTPGQRACVRYGDPREHQSQHAKNEDNPSHCLFPSVRTIKDAAVTAGIATSADWSPFRDPVIILCKKRARGGAYGCRQSAVRGSRLQMRSLPKPLKGQTQSQPGRHSSTFRTPTQCMNWGTACATNRAEMEVTPCSRSLWLSASLPVPRV
jgi:hypothetical protein